VAAIDDSDKELVRTRTDILALVGQYTMLRRTGSNYKGICPFHQEKTPSFHVDPELGRWRCFGACSEGGDVFKFLQKAENLTFREALERLAERAGVVLASAGGDREETHRIQQERDALYAANATAQRFFRETFVRDAMAREYAEKRGLAHQTIEAFGIGYAPDRWEDLADFLRDQKVRMEDAEKGGLIFPSRRADGSYTDKFRGRLMFPIIDTQERIVGFGGRLLVPAENAPKYLNSPETPVFSKSKVLYGLNRARKAIEKADRTLVVEGYLDVIACHQAGIENVVAPLGTSLTEEHVRLIRRYTRNVVLSFDADEAGVRAALRAAEMFRSVRDIVGSAVEGSLRILALPPGEDPDSLLQKAGAPAFRRAIEAALTVSEFRLKGLLARHDTTTDEGRIAFLRAALPIVADAASILEQDLLIGRLAPYHPSFGSSGDRAEKSLREEMDRLRGAANPSGAEIIIPPYRHGQAPSPTWRPGGRPAPPVSDAPPPPTRNAAENAERTLLRALLSEEWAEKAVTSLRAAAGPERAVSILFPTPRCGVLADALVGPDPGTRTSPRRLLARSSTPELEDLVDEIRMEDEDEAPLNHEAILDCVHTLKLRPLRVANELLTRAQREGNRTLTDEELRQWSRRSRATKQNGGAPQT
jgi:DNA primase